jgi:hypothetical protein
VASTKERRQPRRDYWASCALFFMCALFLVWSWVLGMLASTFAREGSGPWERNSGVWQLGSLVAWGLRPAVERLKLSAPPLPPKPSAAQPPQASRERLDWSHLGAPARPPCAERQILCTSPWDFWNITTTSSEAMKADGRPVCQRAKHLDLPEATGQESHWLPFVFLGGPLNPILETLQP